MIDVVWDVQAGADGAALLGALVEAGASLERIERTVGALGTGHVRMSVSGGGGGTVVRVRGPAGAPTAELWSDLRPRVEMLAVDDPTRDLTVALLDALYAARGEVHRVPALQVEVDAFRGADDLAAAVALAAATTSLGEVASARVSPVGIGSGSLDTIEGPVPLPGPVVAVLLEGRETVVHDVAVELTDPVGAAYLRAIGTERVGATEARPEVAVRSGRGRLPGAGDGAVVLSLVERAPAT